MNPEKFTPANIERVADILFARIQTSGKVTFPDAVEEAKKLDLDDDVAHAALGHLWRRGIRMQFVDWNGLTPRMATNEEVTYMIRCYRESDRGPRDPVVAAWMNNVQVVWAPDGYTPKEKDSPSWIVCFRSSNESSEKE